MKLEEGKIYHVKHSRKGSFDMLIESQSNEWIDGIIVNGKADAVLMHNEKITGDEICVRRSFCHFIEKS